MADNMIESMSLVKPETPILAFIKETAEKEGFLAYEIHCSPDNLPDTVRNLAKIGAKIIVGSISTSEKRWNTKYMHKRGLLTNYERPSNLDEEKLSSCVPVALKNLGFNISSNAVTNIATEYDSSIKNNQNYHGHVMSLQIKDENFKLNDQHGSGIITPEVLIKMAQFRISCDKTANQGYFLLKKVKTLEQQIYF